MVSNITPTGRRKQYMQRGISTTAGKRSEKSQAEENEGVKIFTGYDGCVLIYFVPFPFTDGSVRPSRSHRVRDDESFGESILIISKLSAFSFTSLQYYFV